MNQTQLEYFISVAELGSFTKAAKRHFVSQTAVTQQIQNLEEALHASLFDRKKRPVSLTEEGAAFLVDAKAILERMNGAVSKIAIMSGSDGGTLSLGYTRGYEYSRLSKTLRSFRREHPNVFITCRRCNCGEMAQALLSEDLDIIFTWDHDEIIDCEGLQWRKVEESTLDVVIYNTHPFVNRSYLTRNDLKEEELLYLSPSGSYLSDAYRQKYIDAGFEPKVVFHTDDIGSILMMVAAEEGISVMPRYITQRINGLEGIHCIPLAGTDENASVVAVWRGDNDNAVLNSFVDYL